MKILILQGHPDPSETHLCHAIAENYRRGAEQKGHDVQVIMIAKEDVPYLRSKAEWESGDPPQVAQNRTGRGARRRSRRFSVPPLDGGHSSTC